MVTFYGTQPAEMIGALNAFAFSTFPLHLKESRVFSLINLGLLLNLVILHISDYEVSNYSAAIYLTLHRSQLYKSDLRPENKFESGY